MLEICLFLSMKWSKANDAIYQLCFLPSSLQNPQIPYNSLCFSTLAFVSLDIWRKMKVFCFMLYFCHIFLQALIICLGWEFFSSSLYIFCKYSTSFKRIRQKIVFQGLTYLLILFLTSIYNLFLKMSKMSVPLPQIECVLWFQLHVTCICCVYVYNPQQNHCSHTTGRWIKM